MKTLLGVVSDKEIYCDVDDESSVRETLQLLHDLTGVTWNSFKEDSGNNNLVFYKVHLFDVVEDSVRRHLHFCGDSDVELELPLNCSSCSQMFMGCDIHQNIDLDTRNIQDMSCMFEGCIIREGVSFGDMFYTNKVKCMDSMFEKCQFFGDFAVGDHFDMCSVEECFAMFRECVFFKGFSLGNKINLSNAYCIESMFCGCNLPEGFSLGDNFDTSNVKYMSSVFHNCTYSDGFKLPLGFSVKSAIDVQNLFCGCKITKGFLSNLRLDNQREDLWTVMFEGCILEPDGDFKSIDDIITWLRDGMKYFDKEE